MANGHVLIVRIFRHRPAGDFLDRSRGAVPGKHRLRKDIPSVVEVDYFLETEQIAVVHVGLHKTGVRNHACIADCRGLELAFEERQKLPPTEIGRRSVEAIEEKAYSFVGEAWPKRIPCETKLIRRVLRIPRENDVPRKSEIVVGEVGEQWGDVGGHTSVCSLGRIRSSVQMAGVALRFTAEKVVTGHFLRG